MRYFSRHSALSFKIEKHAGVIKMDKNRLKIALPVLDAVEVRFPEFQELIDCILKEECEKERMTADEVILYRFESKKLVWINILVLDLVLKCLFLFIDVESIDR